MRLRFLSAAGALAALASMAIDTSTATPLCEPNTTGDQSASACQVYDTGRSGQQPRLLGLFSKLSAEHLAVWRAADFLLLGEIHDNAAHHSLRATLIAHARSTAFEQIRADQLPALEAFAALPPLTRATADLVRLIDWDKSPWSKTSNYTPLFEAAVANKGPILAADPAREVIRATAKTGPEALAASERARLGLDTPLPDAQNAASLVEIEASHCGMIPKAAHPNMAFAQRYRDAHMADVLIKAATAHGGATLIAGNGHVRADRGVPWYLAQRAPDKKAIAILFVEVDDARADPATYVERDAAGRPNADYIVFTPRAARTGDPCDAMKPKPSKP